MKLIDNLITHFKIINDNKTILIMNLTDTFSKLIGKFEQLKYSDLRNRNSPLLSSFFYRLEFYTHNCC